VGALDQSVGGNQQPTGQNRTIVADKRAARPALYAFYQLLFIGERMNVSAGSYSDGSALFQPLRLRLCLHRARLSLTRN
jgi:hypothetical protein